MRLTHREVDMCVESLPGRKTEEIDFPLDGLARRLLIWRGNVQKVQQKGEVMVSSWEQ